MAQEIDVRLWGGRFSKSPSPALTDLSSSHGSDWRLALYDLAGSQAHARELHRAGVLGEAELQRMLTALDDLGTRVREGSFTPAEEDEDVHTALERGLLESLGVLGGKLRAGRSRNDQCVTDLRLYLRESARSVVADITSLEEALIAQARAHMNTVVPGFTHLQPAQPISFAHLLAAHAQALSRDVERFRNWDGRAALSPLGAAALAGSTIALQPEKSAAELGFDGVCRNSIDAVSDRDFVAEFLFATALLGVHLSRLAEEMCLWTSRQFGWVVLDDGYATGSSIMPQKKNPDIAELTRGRAARFIGAVTANLTMLKGLPLAYNRDMGEDKHEVFDAVDAIGPVLRAMTGMVATMTVDTKAMASAATDGFTLATDVADWLARRGVPFREAHEIVGRLVRFCEKSSLGLADVSAAQLAEVDARLTADVRGVLDADAALAARSGSCGTAPQQVQRQLDDLAEDVRSDRVWASAPTASAYAGESR